MQERQCLADRQPPARLSLIDDRKQADIMPLFRQLQRHFVGNSRAKGVTAEIKRSGRLTGQQRLYVTRGDLTDGVSGSSFRSAAKTEKGTICSHAHSEPV